MEHFLLDIPSLTHNPLQQGISLRLLVIRVRMEKSFCINISMLRLCTRSFFFTSNLHRSRIWRMGMVLVWDSYSGSGSEQAKAKATSTCPPSTHSNTKILNAMV